LLGFCQAPNWHLASGLRALDLVSQKLVQVAAAFYGHEIITTANVVTVDENLRHRVPSGSIDHLQLADRIGGDINLFVTHAFAIQVILGERAERALTLGINLYL